MDHTNAPVKHRTLDEAVDDISKKSANQIADIMREWGIKGRPGTTHLCPLATIMHKIYGGDYIVGKEFIMRRSGNKTERKPTPKGCVQFITKFDVGEYPDLMAPPPRVLGETRKPIKSTGEKKQLRVKRNFPSREVGRFEE